MPPLSNYGICYEAIQRVYRNAVLNAVRIRLQAAYPDDWEARAKVPFKKQWAELEASAHERRTTGELGTSLRDTLDYLGVNHFYNLFEKYFDIIFPAPSGADLDVRQQERQVVLSWAKGIKGLRDPLSHPSEEDLPLNDAFRMLDDGRRLLLKLDSEAATELDTLLLRLLEIDSQAMSRRSLEGYLPAEEHVATGFVGRAGELTALSKWLTNPRAPRWALMGDGGKGKSAIAYEFGCRVKGERSRRS